MTGIERAAERARSPSAPNFPPALDLIAPVVGVVGLVAAAVDAGGNAAVALLRTFAGAAFLGAVTDAMLLGHWYLVQPGLPRRHLNELVDALGWVWPVEVVALLLPTGMVSVWTGCRRRRLERHARLVLGGLRGDDDRARVRHQGGADASGTTRR